MKERTVYISRNHKNGKIQTLGNCTVRDEDNIPVFSSLSLERGWNDNEKNISCVPIGEYDLVYEYSNKFKKHLWELKGVENRSETKFHSASFWFDLNGCISLGQWLIDMNRDGYYDLASSRATMRSFHRVLRGLKKVKLIIE